MPQKLISPMKKRIICAGTFDTLHTGHLAYFESAKALAKDAELIVIVARDTTSEKIKKKKPKNNEEKRLAVISKLPIVNKAVLGYPDGRIIERIISLRPDIIALGHDQWAKEDWLTKELQKHGLVVKIKRMPRFEKRSLSVE